MSKLFEAPADLGQYLFRITDNGGRTRDRYTIVFSDGNVLSLSHIPEEDDELNAFDIFSDGIDPRVQNDWVEEGRCVDLALGDLPDRLAEYILSECNDVFRYFVDRITSGKGVACSREEASVHEGLVNSFGQGLYRTNGAFRIRLDGIGPADDCGPYRNLIEALRATLPDHHSFAEPEHHSSIGDLCRMTADPEVLAKVADLEAIVAVEAGIRPLAA